MGTGLDGGAGSVGGGLEGGAGSVGCGLGGGLKGSLEGGGFGSLEGGGFGFLSLTAGGAGEGPLGGIGGPLGGIGGSTDLEGRGRVVGGARGCTTGGATGVGSGSSSGVGDLFLLNGDLLLFPNVAPFSFPGGPGDLLRCSLGESVFSIPLFCCSSWSTLIFRFAGMGDLGKTGRVRSASTGALASK